LIRVLAIVRAIVRARVRVGVLAWTICRVRARVGVALLLVRVAFLFRARTWSLSLGFLRFLIP
jgi:hypothetical protein